MSVHVFVDETKENGYLVTAAAVLPGNLAHAPAGHAWARAARATADPLRQGKRRAAQTNLDTIEDLAPAVTLYDSSRHPRRKQREACLHHLVADLTRADPTAHTVGIVTA